MSFYIYFYVYCYLKETVNENVKRERHVHISVFNSVPGGSYRVRLDVLLTTLGGRFGSYLHARSF